jgi:hypothetical protein
MSALKVRFLIAVEALESDIFRPVDSKVGIPIVMGGKVEIRNSARRKSRNPQI